MFPIPTDRLHKFAAIAGLAVALAAGDGLLAQYRETVLQENEFAGKVLSMGATYEEFAGRSREQIERTERLSSPSLTAAERQKLDVESNEYREYARKNEQEFRAAEAAAKKQQFLVQHHHQMQRIWLAVAIAALVLGLTASAWGFGHWFRQSRDER